MYVYLGHVHPPVPGERASPSVLPLHAHVLHISIGINMSNIRLRVHSTLYTVSHTSIGINMSNIRIYQ